MGFLWGFLVPLMCLVTGALAAPWLSRAYFRYLVPEINSLCTQEERASLHAYLVAHLAGGRFFPLRPARALVWPLGVACFILLVRHPGLIPPVFAGAIALWAFPMIQLGPWFVWRSDVRITARRRMVEMGVPLCVYCGYDLRAATGETCPECGNGPYPGVIKPTKRRTAAMT